MIMNNLSKRFLAILLLLMVVFTLGSTAVFAEEYNEVDNGFETLSFDTHIKLNENNTYEVTETIVVDFKEHRHGIYRYIPYKGVINDKAKDIYKKYRSDIKKIKVYNENKDISYENGNVIIRIGDEDKEIIGEKTYKISYIIDAKDDGLPNVDMLYINAFPTGWRTAINKGTFTIELPKPIDPKAVGIYSGKYGSIDSNKIEFNVEPTKISGSIKSPLEPFEGITVHAYLKEGYFVNETTNRPLIILTWVLITGIPLLILFLYWLYGRDDDFVKVTSFSPPTGMTSAEVGYIMDSSVDDKDILSLIIFWADKGYLSIEELDDGKDFVLRKLRDLPADAKQYEKTVFNKFFHNREEVETSSLKGSFYNTLALAKTQVQHLFTKSKGTSLFTTSSIVCQVIAILFALVPIIAATFIGGYIHIIDGLYLVGFGVSIAVLLLIYILVLVTATRWYVMSKKSKTTVIISSIIAGGFSFALIAVMYIAAIGNLMVIAIALAGSLISLICACAMPKRTEQCNIWYGQILGLREFIEYAEKERLEMLVQQDPQYFYNVLPFAYVLGISDVWSKKFENIALEQPSWYRGYSYERYPFNTFYFMNSFNHCMTNMKEISVPPAQTNAKIGGGNSFGGGGGFTGGGFGGGGGGSW